MSATEPPTSCERGRTWNWPTIWAYLGFLAAAMAAGWTFVVMGVVSDIKQEMPTSCTPREATDGR